MIGGGYVDSAPREGMILGVVGSRANFDAMVYLLRKRLEQAHVSGAARRQHLRYLRTDARRVGSDGDELAHRIRMDHLVGEHPMRSDSTMARYERLAAVSRTEAERWLDAQLQPSAATLIVTGNFDPAVARRTITQWLGPWAPDPVPAPVAREWDPVAAAEGSRTVVLPDSQGSQFLLNLGCQLTGRAGPDGPAYELAAAWLDHALFDELRVQRGLTCGAYAWVSDLPDGGALLRGRARVEREGLAEALGVMRQSLATLSAGPDAAELEVLAHRLSSEQAMTQGSPAEIHSSLIGEVFRPGQLERQATWTRSLAAIGSEDVAQVMQACAGKEVLTIQGAADHAQAELARIGWGEVEVVEVKGGDPGSPVVNEL